ncbi:hypothetical protein TW95_gp1070 [Pandoravirus inopinatum]|uniref:Uncharacterized protein n=1 Tax=Pandoravirus inopinatum TaxID=1605721 RepID=A0A0B5J2L5_9VIRU|nr:hypothetical protein TW95_gp1070 [Pandoravirus inopinatum]AJF97804.1 hypothetical protein [Pandoravirus inopinatum]
MDLAFWPSGACCCASQRPVLFSSSSPSPAFCTLTATNNIGLFLCVGGCSLRVESNSTGLCGPAWHRPVDFLDLGNFFSCRPITPAAGFCQEKKEGGDQSDRAKIEKKGRPA